MNVILFECGTQVFAIDAQRVLQVIEPPPVTPLPFVADQVEGLVNVGGRVMVLVNLSASLDEGQWVEGGVCVVVRTERWPFAVRVSKVLMMVPVDEAELHPLDHAHGDDDQAFLAAEFAWRDRMVIMLEPDRFQLGEQSMQALPDASEFRFSDTAQPTETQGASTVPWLIVAVGDERFAVDVREVTEVVEAADFLPVPKAPPEVIGFHSLRGAPLLVASLPRLLGLPQSPAHHVIVVGQPDCGRLGLAVGRVLGIRDLPIEKAEKVGDATGAVSGCLTDDNGALLSLLDLTHVLTAEQMASLREYIPHHGEFDARSTTKAASTRHLLTFWLGEELCGIELDAVQRVAECLGWRELPNGTDPAIAGAAQVGNEVMPVVDMRRRLGMPADTEPTAQVVAQVQGQSCALAVDRLNRIIEVPEETFRSVTEQGSDVVSAVGNVDGTLVSLLSIDRLLMVA